MELSNSLSFIVLISKEYNKKRLTKPNCTSVHIKRAQKNWIPRLTWISVRFESMGQRWFEENRRCLINTCHMAVRPHSHFRFYKTHTEKKQAWTVTRISVNSRSVHRLKATQQILYRKQEKWIRSVHVKERFGVGMENIGTCNAFQRWKSIACGVKITCCDEEWYCVFS